jgi:peptide/nickel transport system permease protein
MIIFFINLPYLIYSPYRMIWVIVIIALLDVGRVAEIITTNMKAIQKQPYMEAAISAGTSPVNLIRRYYFPILIPEIIVHF